MKDQKILPIRIDSEMHDDLRKLAFITKISMAELIRQSIKTKLKDYKKLLTKTDIAI